MGIRLQLQVQRLDVRPSLWIGQPSDNYHDLLPGPAARARWQSFELLRQDGQLAPQRVEQKARVLRALSAALALVGVERQAPFATQFDPAGAHSFGLLTLLEADRAPALKPGSRRVRSEKIDEDELVDHYAVAGDERISSPLCRNAHRNVPGQAQRDAIEQPASQRLAKVRDQPSHQAPVKHRPVVSLITCAVATTLPLAAPRVQSPTEQEANSGLFEGPACIALSVQCSPYLLRCCHFVGVAAARARLADLRVLDSPSLSESEYSDCPK